MARMRAAVMVAATTAMAATGASLAYVFFTGPPQPPPAPSPEPSPLRAPQLSPPSPLPGAKHHYSPPPDLPLSSKLPSIRNSYFDKLEPETASQCDYGPLGMHCQRQWRLRGFRGGFTRVSGEMQELEELVTSSLYQIFRQFSSRFISN